MRLKTLYSAKIWNIASSAGEEEKYKPLELDRKAGSGSLSYAVC